MQLGVLSMVAIIMTVGVYGLVAAIIKLDDIGLKLLSQKKGILLKFKHLAGRGLILMAPILLKILSVLGTLAMFLVGGGIIVHGIPYLNHLTEVSHLLFSFLLNLSVGVAVGIVVLLLYKLKRFIRPA